MPLVPRQTRLPGVTGEVPYYGGRFTPAQAYAAAHPPTRPVDRTEERRAALRRLLDTGVITRDELEVLERRFGL